MHRGQLMNNFTGSLESEHIGRSRLMSVRMLGNSVSEMATQAQPLLKDTGIIHLRIGW